MSDLDDYAQRYAAQYERGSFETHLIAIRRRHVLRWLERYGPHRILEVGCGLEPLFSHYDQFDAWRIIEPIPEFAARARELAAGDTRIEAHEGYVEDQAKSVSGEEFDFIVVSSLVHEVPDPLRLLTAVRSLCGESTLVHVNVPNMLSFHRLLAVEMGLIDDVYQPSERDRAFGHKAQFDRETLGELLDRAGFRVVESGTYFIKPFTHRQMEAILETGAFPPSLGDGLDRMTKYMPEHGSELYANARRA